MVARSPYRSVELRRWREIRLAARTWALFRGSAGNRASWEAPAGLEENSAVAINCHTGRKPMWMMLVIAAVVSIAFGLIAVGRAWYELRPLTDKERARLRQEGN